MVMMTEPLAADPAPLYMEVGEDNNNPWPLCHRLFFFVLGVVSGRRGGAADGRGTCRGRHMSG